jgi:hypothetical protein
MVLSFPGCKRAQQVESDVSIQASVSPQPVAVGPATVNIKLSDPHGGRLTGAKVNVEADMSHPGMSPVFADAKELPPGNYQARLLLGMAGDWVVILHVRLPNGQQLERQIDVKGVRSN